MAHNGHNDDLNVSIRLSKRTLERAFYWFAIIVLVILLIISYVGDKDCVNSGNDTANVVAEGDNLVAGEDSDVVTEPVVEPIEDDSEDDLLPLPAKIEVQPEPEPEPEPEVDPEPEPVELSGKVEFSVPISGIDIDDLGDGRVKIKKLTVNIENGKEYAIEGYKVLIYAYGDEETAAAVKSKERVEKDGFVVPSTVSGEKEVMKLDLSDESIFNVDSEVIIKVKLFDDRDKLLESLQVEKKA